MESVGKRQWKKQLAQSKVGEGKNMAGVGNQNEGLSSSREKRTATAPVAAEVMPQTI